MLAINEFINTFSQEREAIETRLVNNFDTNVVPVQYGNVNFLKKGSETIPTPYKGDKWIRLTILGGTASRPEVTRTFNQINSIIDIGIFTKMDIGSAAGRAIADQLFDIFNATSFNGIITEAASLRELPPNNGWYQLNISIPYRWYRCLNP